MEETARLNHQWQKRKQKPQTFTETRSSTSIFGSAKKRIPSVQTYLKAEDAFADAAMKHTAALQEKLYNEMLSHIKETDTNVPYRNGNYFYFSKTEKGKQYPIFFRKKGSLDAPEEIILDQNELAKGQTFMSVGMLNPSDDGNLLAYSTDNTGYRQYTLQIKDLRTGQLLSEKIERVTGLAWANDNKTIFYVTEDPVTKRSDKFFRHVLGTDKTDLVYEEKDEMFDIGAWSLARQESDLSRDRSVRPQPRSITFSQRSRIPLSRSFSRGSLSTSTTLIIATAFSTFEPTRERRTSASSLRLVNDPSEKNWKEFVAHRPAVKLEGISLFSNHAVLSEWESGLQHLEVIDFKTDKRHRIKLPEPVYSVELSSNREFNTTVVRYGYNSLVTPFSVFDYDMNTGKSTLLKQTEVPGGFDRTNYKAERVFATASDGTKIPMSIVYRKGTKLDGTAPLLLYGYGSYGYAIPPTFSSNRLSLLDRGVIFVIGHIRGGGEMGEEWRQAGRMMTKMNTFTDFIACAEALIKMKYTSKDRLVIEGGSAGGLLMGVVSNLRPDLFKAVISHVPFVDVLNTMLDASIPLTTSEYIEWGNPNEKPAYEYMKKYSPYDNIEKKNYPATLVKVSVNDSQVPYWEGAKLVAKLRAMKTDTNPLLLKVNFGAGHGGASGRYDALRETAFDYAFTLWQMGISE